MSSSGGTAPTTGAGLQHDRDYYEPEQQGVRNIAARDGYEAGDGYTRTQPQVRSNHASGTSQSSYLYGNNGHPRSSSAGAYQEDYGRRGNGYQYGTGDYDRVYTTPRRDRHATRGREYVPDDYTDEDDYSDFEEDRRGRDDRAVTKRRDTDKKSDRGRSQSRIRQKLNDMFKSDEKDMGTGNTEPKKWAATVAGAVAGGFAGRTARKDHWVPTALGALIGGLAAREAEKMFYVNKDIKEQEKLAYEGKLRSKSHER